MPEIEPLVTIEKAADFLAVSRWWLYENGDALGVPCYRIGRTRKYILSELNRWARAQKVNAPL